MLFQKLHKHWCIRLKFKKKFRNNGNKSNIVCTSNYTLVSVWKAVYRFTINLTSKWFLETYMGNKDVADDFRS